MNRARSPAFSGVRMGKPVLRDAAVDYLTAIVAAGPDAKSPALTTTPKLPASTLSGIWKLICETPATKPGAHPAYFTCASLPLTATRTEAAMSHRSELSAPSLPLGD